jgi:acetyl-CoA acetyltransferase
MFASVAGVHLLGVASTSHSRRGAGPPELAREAVGGALADAGLGLDEVDGIAVAAVDSGFLGAVEGALGKGRRRFDCRCGLGPVAFDSAWKAVASGVAEVIVCVGFDRGGPEAALDADAARLEAQAAAAREYLQHSGATEQHLARVAAKNFRHGAANPAAAVGAEVGVEEVLASETLLPPLRRLMVASPAHSAAAVVLGTLAHGNRRGAKVPLVRASVLLDAGSEGGAETSRAARLAYLSAEIDPHEVDLAEIEDPTPVEELAAYEALEFGPEGSGPELVESGFTALGGVLPVNVSGGALCLGFSRGAGGIRQLVELSLQLRDRAGRRQVPGARVGLGLCGGPATPTGPTALTIVSL